MARATSSLPTPDSPLPRAVVRGVPATRSPSPTPPPLPAARPTTHGDRGVLSRAAIAGYCQAHTRDSLLATMASEQIPICAVYTPDEALAAELVAERGLIAYNGETERTPYLVNPLHRAGLTRSTPRPAPGLGADNEGILRDLGYDDEERAALEKDGAFS